MKNSMTKTAGRYNGEVGVVRVDHDGKKHVVSPSSVEASVEERLNWYYNCGASDEDKILVKNPRLETQYDDGGNPMWRNESFRTAMPRPHQYSIERRLEEQRNPDSTESIVSDAKLEVALGQAFTQISTIVLSNTVLKNNDLNKISSSTGVPVSELVILKRIAEQDRGLAKKFAGKCGCQDVEEIPGVAKKTKKKGPVIKETDDEEDKGEECSEEELASIGTEVDL